MPPAGDPPLFMAQHFLQNGYQTILSNHLKVPVTPEQAGFHIQTLTSPTMPGTA